jgi:chemotaxis protein MotA
MAAKAGKSKGGKPDIASFLGIVVALGGIVGGLLLEGGKLSDIKQFTAAIIVLGGTLGAVMLTTPLSVLIGGVKQLGAVFLEKSHNPSDIIEEIIGYATRARKNGIVSLESELEKIHDPFLKKALSLAVDGTDLQELRKIMELEIIAEEERNEAEAKIYEVAGGYAPTVGIIGAVLGLIQVMKDLADIEKVGHGIATAFVATVYGVALSNLFCLPAASKLKSRAHHAMKSKELMLEGIVSIVEGMNPKLIRMKLAAYEEQGAGKKVKKQAGAAAPAAKPASAEG